VPVDVAPQPIELEAALRQRVAELEAALSAATTSLAKVTEERDKLRRAYENLKGQLEMLRHRIFVAKAERVDTRQLELEFAAVKAQLDEVTKRLAEEASAPPSSPDPNASPSGPPASKSKSKSKGRPDLADIEMPEQRIEITDPALEGTAERIGFEISYKLGYRRASRVRIVIARATYKVTSDTAPPSFTTAPAPKEIVQGGMLAPSFIAHVLTKKFRFGMPFTRLAEELRTEGVTCDDSTMCRYAEHVGATLGCIVDACANEARETAFCLSTDATGVAIQPERVPDGRRQACSRGHFFVVLADRDHIFFEYQDKHTSDVVCSMFRGFKGYIQADAHCIYDALFRGDAVDEHEKPPDEVGCWSHARRKFWEAAIATKDADCRQALLRVRKLFDLESDWAGLAPAQRHDRRQRVSRPILDGFFAWAEGVFARVRGVRGPVAAAFGYAIRQRDALCRFLDDGRLRLENNAAERALRQIAVGRKAWLFFGSGVHAQAAANLFSLIASCKLHGIDAETYLAEIIRIVPYWPRTRYLELAPKYWLRTRARLVEAELELPIGHVTVPPPLAAEQETSTS
jgi:transposase